MDISTLEELLSRPSPGLLDDFKSLCGDLMILGVAGKMGPTLAVMARRALPAQNRVIGVSRFSSTEMRQSLENRGVETLVGNLLDEEFLSHLPDVPHIVYMAGMKFGSDDNPATTWAMNTHLPAMVARRFPKARIAAFSTGNVYPFVAVTSGGCDECHPIGPVGEYAQSCLGRERMLQYFSLKNQTPIVIIRLNYAAELRYGVIVDIAARVYAGQSIDLAMGHFNVIWQGDANSMALRSLSLAQSPAEILNVTGAETVSIRWLAQQFGNLFGKSPVFVGHEAETALLNNAARALQLFGPPSVSLPQMICWVAEWIQESKPLLNKPTHFEQRDGRF
jgi:nucleoside-diphosphate-sugar epimerase